MNPLTQPTFKAGFSNDPALKRGNFRDFIERAYYSSDKRFPEETERKWVKVRGFNVKA